jgi:hypothetical protein
MASERPWTTGDHPSPEYLLLASEDELPQEEVARILAHVHQCWECRACVERYTRAIGAYVEFRKLEMDPAAAPAPGAWLRMAARLRAASGEAERPSVTVWRRIPRSLWLALPAMAAAAVLIALMVSPAKLTATVVFDRAMRAETAEQNHPTKKRISVRRRGKLVAVEDVVLKAAYIERSQPMSVRSLQRWHDGLRSKVDSVTSADNEVRLETRTEEGTISLARLTVASVNFLPRTKHVELRDGISIDVEATEDFSPVPEATNEASGAESQASAPATATASGLDREQREAIEMEVRWALRRIDADLGEALAVNASGAELVVEGTLDDEVRRDQIVSALAGLSHVSARLKLAASNQAILAKAQPVEPAESPANQMAAPLLVLQLKRDLPDPQARAEFVSAALDISQKILRHMWALRRLAQRYPVTAESRLQADVRASLERLVMTHKEAAGTAAQEAATLWKPYAQLDSSAVHSRTTWQQAARDALRSAQAFDHLSARLLAATGDDGLTSAEALTRLRESQRQLLTALAGVQERP